MSGTTNLLGISYSYMKQTSSRETSRGRTVKRHRKAATAALGLCFATAFNTPSLAFQLRAGITTQSSGTGSLSSGHDACHAAFSSRGSARAACRLSMHANEGGDHSLSEDDTEQSSASGTPHHHGHARLPSGAVAGGSKDIAALVLSALLLGNPELSEAATPAVDSAINQPARQQQDATTQQDRMIADLEKKLMDLSSSSSSSGNSDGGGSGTASLPSNQQQEPGAAAGALSSAQESASAAASTAAASVSSVFSSLVDNNNSPPPPPQQTPAPRTTTQSDPGKMSKEQQSLIKLQEYTFSVTLPELNLPTVGPITVPEEGSLLQGLGSGKGEKVEAAGDWNPLGRALRDVLVKAGSGDGARGLREAITGMMPKQAEYNRALTELEHRVYDNVRTVDNPVFAPEVPLDPEFTSMLSQAKETAFQRIRSYLPKGVEPELALFMLVTLPVLTVALRAADENSRKPKEPSPPEGFRAPRITRYPNSPAKADAEAVAEARAAAAAVTAKALAAAAVAAATDAVTITCPGDTATATSTVTATTSGLKDGVNAAAEADPERLRAELAQLRMELAATNKLATKLEALERANLRLMEQVANLSKQPSLQEIQSRAEREEARAIARRELEEKQAAAYRSVEEKESKLTVAREILADSFPLRDTPPMGFAVGEAAGGLGEQSTTSKEVEEVGAKTPAGKKRKTKAASTKKSSPATASSATKPESAGKKTATTAVPVMEKDGGDDGVEATREDAVVEKKPRKPAARKNAAKDQAEEEADNTATPPLSPAVTAAVSAGVAAAASTSAQNGSLQPAMDASTTVPVGTKQATGEQTADEYDDLSEDLSRALRGVQGFDLDALDLEMDDLRPEDLEELRNLEREMGDLDMASLEAEFDQEDDETISHALRMAAESAMAHTSGGGRRIRTASAVGATSARSASAVGNSGAPVQADMENAMVGSGSGGAGGGVNVFQADDGLDAYASMGEGARGQEMGGGFAIGDGGRKGGDEDDWARMTLPEIKKKTVAQLKGYLDEVGIYYPARVKKGELVDIVKDWLA